MQTMTDTFRASRRAGVPLVAIETPDPAAAVAELCKALNGKREETPVIRFDVIRGPAGITEPGQTWLDDTSNGRDPAARANPTEFLTECAGLPESALVFILGAPRILTDGGLPACQAVWNLRDTLKPQGAQVALIGPLGWKLPAELAGDVLTITHALPTEAELAPMIQDLAQSAKITIDDATTKKAVDALLGIASYPAEQATALSITKAGIDLDGLWERKRKTIETARGLSVHRGKKKFAQIGGLDTLKEFLSKIETRTVLFIDEIEKAQGSQLDTSGVSQGFMASFLSWTQETDTTGIILVGPAGTGKSEIAKAFGNEKGIPTISLDIGGLRAGIVGESEQNTRAAFHTIDAVAQGQCFMIATCNGMAALTPEMRRRFTMGIYYVDLPTADELAAIWPIWLDIYRRDPAEKLPPCDGWTGAEVKACCRIADTRKCSLIEAGRYILPMAKSSSAKIEALRREASGNFLSTSYPGAYKYDTTAPTTKPGRKMEV